MAGQNPPPPFSAKKLGKQYSRKFNKNSTPLQKVELF
uniref:Uncharacterized protein n=1 Tax=Phage sp. ctrsQ3 TaxID=2826752 RepID=A0A8S5MG83_9VIRU|nr:MAG TPA: hypothetical protein [Phage sp. ctrsQ3]